MTDFYKNNYYLARALEWIRAQEDDDAVFAEVLLKELEMSLAEVNDYLTAFGVRPEIRAEIMEGLK